MIRCPKCNSDDTKIHVEAIYADSISFDWKMKGKGIKQIKYNIRNRALPYPEIRVFFDCNSCSYSSDNLNGFDTLEGTDEEVQLILHQIHKSING
ncbi:hypothetical protein EEL30_21860 [Brevibacillus laterosporus]|uniref:Uncharacterized protein n=1 Tax=Brevibacillus laterosporus TaxID=1465 RepID=A0A518VCK6_BRELA|nr:hypothetical protein EEL30_19965 [Brevibacillus laterosporus]QDX94689.1 hypothetical protein EEL30_21860 [Brevibacillus laterosporus]